MSALVTDAIVLHAFDYLETSRIVRLLTREAGVVSVLARGARRSRARFGSALDLFAEGTAELQIRPQRDLQSLSALDVTHSRPQLAQDIGRFTAAAMIAELTLRFVGEESGSLIFDTVSEILDQIGESESANTIAAGLAGAWRIVAALGLTPATDVCASCHAELNEKSDVAFSHRAGGALCQRCEKLVTPTRRLPADARSLIRAWLEGVASRDLPEPEARSHQRLLREFVQEHLGEDRPLRAFQVWEHERWSAA